MINTVKTKIMYRKHHSLGKEDLASDNVKFMSNLFKFN